MDQEASIRFLRGRDLQSRWRVSEQFRSLALLNAGAGADGYDAGRVRAVKLVFASGTTQDCNGGQPASVVALRQRERIAGEICAGATAPLSGSAYTK